MKRALLYVWLMSCSVIGCKGGSNERAPGASNGLAIGRLGAKWQPPGEEGMPADELLVIERDPHRRTDGRTGAGEALEGGELRARIDGEERELPLPLRHTDVKGRITLHVASVKVLQQYENPYSGKIEAIYRFPLPDNAAVTDFLMKIGERTIRGIVREREEARRIYLAARAQGMVAALLSQERPNIFTQSVANIEPGKRIDIEIDYFHTLRCADGEYEFHFPMVVGPRFTPPGSEAAAVKVPYLKPREISPNLVSLSVEVDAGLELASVGSPSHSIDIRRDGKSRAVIDLRGGETIPNRDFVLRYRMAGEGARGALATTHEGEEGYFTLLLQPPEDLETLPFCAREMIFLVDCSGSMDGEPFAACKRVMRRCLERLTPADSFQILRFSEKATMLADAPISATPGNVRRGLRYVDQLEIGGGTMMQRGLHAALATPHEPGRYRIVTLLTDGYVDNERELLGEIHSNLGDARLFCCGVGNSVNGYLMESASRMGRGVAAFMMLDESGDRMVDAVYRRIERPALTDLSIDWGGLKAEQVCPDPLPDLYCGRPVVIHGRFSGAEAGEIRVTGTVGGERRTLTIAVAPDRGQPALAKLWARARISSFEDQMARVSNPLELQQLACDTALRYGLVSSYTSFLAVDASRVTEGASGTTIEVPVPVPQGVRYETTVPGAASGQGR